MSDARYMNNMKGLYYRDTALYAGMLIVSRTGLRSNVRDGNVQHSLRGTLRFEGLGAVGASSGLAGSEEDEEADKHQEEPSDLEPQGSLDVGPVGDRARQPGEEAGLNGQADHDTHLQGDLEDRACDTGDLRRYRGQNRDADVLAKPRAYNKLLTWC